MSLYVFMGTHLPEIAHCFDYLARLEADPLGTQIFLPVGLDKGFPESDRITLSPYEPDRQKWDCLNGSGQRNIILLDPGSSPIAQLEALADGLKTIGLQPDKIITCVDTHAAEQSVQLRSFLEACIYYSDIVLLGNRQDASKAFVRNFQQGYERSCYPCLFLMLKGKGLPSDSLELLVPGVRRISQLFDLVDNEEDTDIPVQIEASCDLDFEEMENDPYRAAGESPSPDMSIPDISQWIVPIQDP